MASAVVPVFMEVPMASKVAKKMIVRMNCGEGGGDGDARTRGRPILPRTSPHHRDMEKKKFQCRKQSLRRQSGARHQNRPTSPGPPGRALRGAMRRGADLGGPSTSHSWRASPLVAQNRRVQQAAQEKARALLNDRGCDPASMLPAGLEGGGRLRRRGARAQESCPRDQFSAAHMRHRNCASRGKSLVFRAPQERERKGPVLARAVLRLPPRHRLVRGN